MKKQKHKAKRAATPPKTNGTPGRTTAKTKAPNRRDFLRGSMSYVVIGAAVGGVGWYLVDDVQATLDEGDLSKIGNGTPAVVQIHDPQCPRCRALQREARAAMDAFDDDELQYLVANIRNDDGRALADAHGVGHVTLVLFDGEGRRRSVLTGPNEAEHLERAFRRHIAKN